MNMNLNGLEIFTDLSAVYLSDKMSHSFRCHLISEMTTAIWTNDNTHGYNPTLSLLRGNPKKVGRILSKLLM